MMDVVAGPVAQLLADVEELFAVAKLADRLTPGMLADGLCHRRCCWRWWNKGEPIQARDVEEMLRLVGAGPGPDGYVAVESVRAAVRSPEVGVAMDVVRRELSEAGGRK